MPNDITITIDHREKASGIFQLLESHQNLELRWDNLKAGDYIINNEIIVERKTAADFIASVISQRIFHQCSLLNRLSMRPLIIIEGDPYLTEYKITPQSVQGALISISLAWQMPVLISRDRSATVKMLLMAAQQSLPNQPPALPLGRKPKRLKNRQLFFLQGIPSVGPSLALRLLQTFGSIENVLRATSKELRQVEGVGKGKALAIQQFLMEPFDEQQPTTDDKARRFSK